MKKLWLLALFSSFAVSCTTVYVVDRQSVLENDSSGSWPNVEKQLLQANRFPGPSFFAQQSDKKKKNQLEAVLNGDLQNP